MRHAQRWQAHVYNVDVIGSIPREGTDVGIFVISLVVALCAAAGAAALYGQLDDTQSTFVKVVLWILIVALGTVAFGIGSCCALILVASGGMLR